MDSKRTGGMIVQRGTYTGKIGILYPKTFSDKGDVELAANFLKSQTQLNVYAATCETSDPAAALKASGANAIIALEDTPGAPELLLAPNDRWAVVNIARIVDDLPSENAKKKFRSPRVRKQIVKAFCALLGGSASQYPGNIMNTVSSRELDLTNEQIPVDVLDRVQKYCNQLKITSAEYVTYKKACQEGWAPAPTNDVQKTVWDKVHAIPSEPIKIKYEKPAKK